MRRGSDLMVVVDGVRVRRDEAAALGIVIPEAAAPPAPETTAETDQKAKRPAANRKARTPANKARTTTENK